MDDSPTTKCCFVVSPIGKEGSDVRIRSDQIFRHIIEPSASECGYFSMRADHISEPGIITSQVIQHVVDDPLMIADLTGRNPNVFYELAIRHAIRKPVVQLIDSSEQIPFDVAATRTIHFDHHDLDSVEKAIAEIKKQIRNVEDNPVEVDSPISVALELQLLRRSDNPLEKSNAEIIDMLQDIRLNIDELRLVTRPNVDNEAYFKISSNLDRLYQLIPSDENQTIQPKKNHHIRSLIANSRRQLERLGKTINISPDDIPF